MKLTIGNSASRIEGATKEQLNELRELTSYRINAQSAYFSGQYRSQKRYLLSKRGDFPTGLLYIVEEYLTGIKHDRIDLRQMPVNKHAFLQSADIKGVTPYPEQVEAAKAAVEHHRGIICAPTGVGKSLIVALIIKQLAVKTLVVVPTLELKRQLIESLSAIFGGQLVGELGSLLAIENVASLDHNEILTDYRCVIIDEFHHSGAKTYRQLNQKAWANIYYRIGLTATPFRANEDERLLLESVLSKVIYRIDYKTAVDKGYIVPMEAYYFDLPKRKVEGYTWNQVYNELVINNEMRNDLITDLMVTLAVFKHPTSTLCLVKEIKHGDILARDGAFPFANGQDENCVNMIRNFNSKASSSLIGTTGVLGEGVDTKPADFVIIAGLGKSKNGFMQQVGRGFRRYPGKENCNIILFRDASHKFTLNHFNAQKKYLLEEYGIIPKLIKKVY